MSTLAREHEFFGNASQKWPGRVGLLNDYVRIPYANGSSFASQLLYRELGARGSEVTVLGPREPNATPSELPLHSVRFPALPFKNHPGVYLPLPSRTSLEEAERQRLDLVLAHCSTGFLELGAWLRRKHDVTYLATNTVHMPSVYNVVLDEKLHQNRAVNVFFSDYFMPWVESLFVDNYNHSDGLIVLSQAFEEYWRSRGVTVPIHVVPRAVEPRIFDPYSREDPFAQGARRGGRLLCICRHTREKSITRLLEIFARWIAPAVPEATLTLVGDGPDHDTFRAQARQLGIEDKTYFPGECAVTEVSTYYRHADLFVYTSLSETYGQVISEAMWCGLAVVALHDNMGVTSQLDDGETGALVMPGPDQEFTEWRFGSEVVALLRNKARREALAAEAERRTRLQKSPERILCRYLEIFGAAKEHNRATQSERSRYRPSRHLYRWTWINTVTAGFGLARAPATVNRNHSRQPGWEQIDSGAEQGRLLTEMPPRPRVTSETSEQEAESSGALGA